MTTVYLAGGMVTDWQSKVKLKVEARRGKNSNIRFLDPQSHGLKDETAYTAWDLKAVDISDWVFAYMEKTNPTGTGMSLEIGYAVAKGKKVIFVDESANPKAFGMHRAVADIVVKDLESGINALVAMIGLD